MSSHFKRNFFGNSRQFSCEQCTYTKGSGIVSDAGLPILNIGAKLFDWFEREGYQVDGAALRREYPEVGWHTFEQWAREQPWDALLKVPA